MQNHEKADIFFALIPWSKDPINPDTALNLSISFGQNSTNSSIATAHFVIEFHLTKMPERNKTVTFGVLY